MKQNNGVYHACLVACRYRQIPCVDFLDNYAPVINDVTYHLMLIYEMLNGYASKIIDFETAFLCGDPEKEIYMDCPDGLTHMAYKCLVLKKKI